MTDALLCDGCLMYQQVDLLSEQLRIVDLNNKNESHLCTDCSKRFFKWMESIEDAD